MKEPHGFPSSALDDELADVRGVVVGDLPPPRCVLAIGVLLSNGNTYSKLTIHALL